MRLLVLGANGMAGHMIVSYMLRQPEYEVFYTTRQKKGPGLYLEAHNAGMVEHVIEAVRPDMIINAMGILNQFAERNPEEAYWINGLLPHMLARSAKQAGGKLIHISTDCVFSGEHGFHAESDSASAVSVYGRSKALGEVCEAPHLTIRTSIIGPERRANGIGLLHWFLQQEGEVSGFRQAFWNGVTTLELAKCLHACMQNYRQLHGLVHLTAPQAISKYELLKLIQQIYNKQNVTLIPNDSVKLNRTLRNTRADFTYQSPDYAAMLREMREWSALI
jgi:dTDP-4-dehydrorhamnose reductase